MGKTCNSRQAHGLDANVHEMVVVKEAEAGSVASASASADSVNEKESVFRLSDPNTLSNIDFATNEKYANRKQLKEGREIVGGHYDYDVQR